MVTTKSAATEVALKVLSDGTQDVQHHADLTLTTIEPASVNQTSFQRPEMLSVTVQTLSRDRRLGFEIE